MTKIKIFYKTENPITQKLLKRENIEKIKEKSKISKIFSSKKEYPNLYFHQGSLDEESIDIINNAKKTITNSYTSKMEIIKACKVDNSQIEVIYPTITSTYLKPKESKEIISKELGFDKKKRIILFNAKNLAKNGVMEFLQIIISLTNDNFIAIIAGDEKQIYTLKFKFTKLNLDDKVFLVEDYPNIDLIYSATDIYILPTYIKGFNSNVLKAMFFKTAVFVSANSDSKEVIDTFSTMDSPTDRSMQFKVDALLNNKEELKKIKKENKELSNEFLFDVQMKRVEEVLSKI